MHSQAKINTDIKLFFEKLQTGLLFWPFGWFWYFTYIIFYWTQKGNRDYFMESARVRDFHTSWCSIWNRTSKRRERVRFLILHQRVWKSRTKRFPCCNLFISYILTFSKPQINILALDKFELRTTRVHRKYYLVKAARQRYSRWPRKSPRKHSLKPWFVIGRNDFFACEKLVSPFWLVEVKSKTLFHTAKFDAKISVCMK